MNLCRMSNVELSEHLNLVLKTQFTHSLTLAHFPNELIAEISLNG